MGLGGYWQPYDINPIAYDPVVFDVFFDSVRTSFRSMGNTGLWIMGIMLSVLLIGSILREILLEKLRLIKGVKNQEFQRKVRSLDRRRNLDAIVDDRVDQMEINMMAKYRFRRRWPWYELEEAVHRREISHKADFEFHRRNPGAYGDKRDLYRRLNDEYYEGRWEIPSRTTQSQPYTDVSHQLPEDVVMYGRGAHMGQGRLREPYKQIAAHASTDNPDNLM